MTTHRLFVLLLLLPIHLALADPPALTDGSILSAQPAGYRYQAGGLDLSCRELEKELTALEPLTYSDKPSFYTDPAHGAAIWGGMLWTPAWGYLGYSGLVAQIEQKHMDDARERIAVLRQLKARQHCYE